MSLHFEPIRDDFGVEVSGLDLCQSLNEQDFAALWQAFNQYGLLLFREQPMDARRLGELARRFPNDGGPPPYQSFLHPECDDITLLGNVARTDSQPPAYLNKIGIEWHTDGTSSATPAIATLLYCVEAPSQGGETLFASGYSAWAALPDETKGKVSAAQVRYDFDQLLQRQAKQNDVPLETIRKKWRSRYEPIVYPMVRTHPATGRQALWVTWAEMDTLVGQTKDESIAWVQEVVAQGTQPNNVYAHRWRANDLVIWDNRCMLHTTTPYTYADQRRLMYRIGLNGNDKSLRLG